MSIEMPHLLFNDDLIFHVDITPIVSLAEVIIRIIKKWLKIRMLGSTIN